MHASRPHIAVSFDEWENALDSENAGRLLAMVALTKANLSMSFEDGTSNWWTAGGRSSKVWSHGGPLKQPEIPANRKTAGARALSVLVKVISGSHK
jgi:hypothetical protein